MADRRTDGQTDRRTDGHRSNDLTFYKTSTSEEIFDLSTLLRYLTDIVPILIDSYSFRKESKQDI